MAETAKNVGYEDRRAGETGRIGEAEADRFLMGHGFDAIRPRGRDTGVDRLITSSEWPGVQVKAQIKGRRQEANPRWFFVSIARSRVRDTTKCGERLDKLWQEQIRMVDFWIMVSLPMNEVWVFPSEKVMKIARLNEPHYLRRLDNRFDKPHYDKKGNIAKKQKELNLDVLDPNGIPLWQRFSAYRNEIAALRQSFAAKSSGGEKG